MNRFLKDGATAALALVMVAGLAGCESTGTGSTADQTRLDRTRMVMEDTTPRTANNAGAARAAAPAPARPAEQPRPATPAAAPAPASTEQPAPRPAPASANVLFIPTGDRASSALMIEKIVPAEVTANRPFDYQIKATNLTRGSLENVIVSDTLGQNFRFNSATPAPATTQGSELSWTLGTLAGGESKTINVNATATGVGQISSCATGSYNTALCSTINVVQPSLAVRVEAPAEALFCDQWCLKYTVTNNGTGAATNVKVNAQLPAGLTTTDGKTAVTLDAGTLAGGQSRSFDVCVKNAQKGTFANTVAATAEGLTASGNTVNTVVRQPVLAIATECPGTVLIGRNMPFKITVSNTGDAVSKNTVVTSALPANTTFVSADNNGANQAGRLSWNVGDLAPGQSRTVGFVARSTGAGTVAIQAQANGVCANQPTAQCQTGVQGVPDIGTSISDIDGVVQVGETHIFSYEVVNQGQVDLTNVTVVADLSEGLEFVSTTWTTPPQVAGKKLTFNVGTVRPGERKTFDIVVRGTAAGEQQMNTETRSAELRRTVRNDEQVTYVNP